ILKAYANSTSAYKAIDKGLKATKSSYGFASMFAGFKDMNSYTEFYKIRDLSAAKSTAVIKKRGERTENVSFDDTDTAATPQMTLTGNSAAYFEFTAPSSSKGKLTVTVETTGGAAADASYNLVLKGKKITIPGRGKTAELMTFVLTDFGGGFSTAVLTAGNISMSSKNTISFDATAFFEEN
ncbi:MAG: hypothetical protein IK093_19465, partial [Ruminiclostridium sp.]|nr:hypothetical protein [Ruminiclostridium sp.]